MNLRDIRDYLKIVVAYLLIWLYLPHVLVYLLRRDVRVHEDLKRFRDGDVIKGSLFTAFI